MLHLILAISAAVLLIGSLVLPMLIPRVSIWVIRVMMVVGLVLAIVVIVIDIWA